MDIYYLQVNKQNGQLILFYMIKRNFKYDQCCNLPQLNEIYQLLQPDDELTLPKHKFLRPMEYFEYIKGIHPKTNSQYSNEQELQALLPFYMGYIFYMIYDRLNLYSDYNGIVGRLLFLENGEYPMHFPISILFKDIQYPYLNNKYRLFNVQLKQFKLSNGGTSDQFNQIYNISTPKFEDKEKYFSIKIDKKDIKKIIVTLAFSILYYQHYYDDQLTKQLLLGYFKNPFGDDSYYDDIKIENFKEIREMINELNWNKEDTQDTMN